MFSVSIYDSIIKDTFIVVASTKASPNIVNINVQRCNNWRALVSTGHRCCRGRAGAASQARSSRLCGVMTAELRTAARSREAD